MDPAKSYYLPPTRSIAVGVILIIVGLAFSFMGIDLQQSFWFNLQRIFISFEGVADFIFSLIMLLFKAGLIAGGYFYIKFSDEVERARLDEKGFHYREIPAGGKFDKISIDLGKLSFKPYSAIKDIQYKKSFWAGGQITLTLASGNLTLPALGVLKDREKQEIVAQVKERIS
jgi:hypothetical protein